MIRFYFYVKPSDTSRFIRFYSVSVLEVLKAQELFEDRGNIYHSSIYIAEPEVGEADDAIIGEALE